MYEIEKGIPMPKSSEYEAKYPFAKMEVGDSFRVEERRESVASAARSYGCRIGKKFSVRKEEGGMRIWRVK
jgi:uncharacterized protein (DUF2249 family)